MAMLTSLIVPLILVVGVALLIDWAASHFLPAAHAPIRIVVGIVVLIWLVTKLLPLLGGHV